MIAIQNLEPGTKVRLRGEIVAEVRENPRDGTWLLVRHLERPDGTAPDAEEMAHADDVLEVL